MHINEKWENYLKSNGAGFVRFVDITSLPKEMTGEFTCAVFFGKALTRDYLKALKAGREPERHEFGETEHEMDALAEKLAGCLAAEGYKSVSELEFARFPHKTAARLAGFGFIGKNTLLISEEFGCAAVFGKVLTTAPFSAGHAQPKEPACGDCNICAEICPEGALSGNQWRLAGRVEELLDENKCAPCLKCMISCPFTEKYINGTGINGINGINGM